METESTRVVARGWRGRQWEVIVEWVEFQFGLMKMFEMGGRDSCTTCECT